MMPPRRERKFLVLFLLSAFVVLQSRVALSDSALPAPAPTSPGTVRQGNEQSAVETAPLRVGPPNPNQGEKNDDKAVGNEPDLETFADTVELGLSDTISPSLLNETSEPTPDLSAAALHSGMLHVTMITSLVLFPPDNWTLGSTPRRDQFHDAWRLPPTFDDGDPWYTNYVGHPVMGAYFFLFSRNNGYGFWASALFTVWRT